MFEPQHVSELLRERLRRAAAAARQVTVAGPVLGVAELLSRFGVAQVELRVEALELIGEREHNAQVPDRFVPDRTVNVWRKDYTVAVPFEGDPQIVRALLSSCTHAPTWGVRDAELRATFTTEPQTPPEQLRAKIDARVTDAAEHLAHGRHALAKYRDDLMQVVTSVVAQMGSAHEAGERQREGLGLPIRLAPQPVPSTPAPAQPPVQRVPSAQSEDELDALFERVVAAMREIGHELEAFTGLTTHLQREEHTRDVLIVCLKSAVPECVFTAETLHGQGKNDIHVRHNDRVVGVIELKNWSSEQNFKDGVDQLLSYLTYRDTRAAIVLLIRNERVSTVIAKTKQWLLEHTNCVDQDMPDGLWRSNFHYHATGDPAQPIKLVYLPFTFTTSATGASTTRGLSAGITTQ
ncbi:hypothetical protein [Micromonospora sp. Llam0]|uniref:hypothetical protein n=1 Tax=Micromonospora sp. Llam0 TaxID=2485143 RepID=UPI0011CE4A9A|nr:hypothetical protein [Micromonospora sp. Llam0]